MAERTMSRQEAARRASQVSARRSFEEKSEAAKKAAKTRLLTIKEAERQGKEGPTSFAEAGRKGAKVRWHHYYSVEDEDRGYYATHPMRPLEEARVDEDYLVDEDYSKEEPDYRWVGDFRKEKEDKAS